VRVLALALVLPVGLLLRGLLLRGLLPPALERREPEQQALERRAPEQERFARTRGSRRGN